MNNWTDMILDDVATIQIGGTPPREISAYWATTSDSGFPWVSIADLQKRVITETKERITEKGVLHSNVKPISQGTLIISFKLSIGRAALAGTDLFTNEAIAAISPKDKRIHSDLLYYVLPGVAKNAITDTAVKGATLNKSSLGKLTFRVPIKYEQQEKIAKILQTIDRTITHTEALIEKYQQIKAGLMHDLFTRGIGADGKLRLPREQAPELYRESSIGWIPKEWKVKSITYFADVIDPNPSHRNPIYHDEGFPFISTVEFESLDQIRLDTSRRVIEEIVVEQERRCKFSAFSIAFSRKGTIGETRFLPSHLRFALLDSLCVINPIDISPSLLFHVLRSHFLKRQIKNMTMGQALPQMSIGRVRDLLIPSPVSVIEQKKIESKLNEIDEFICIHGKELQKLKSKKSGLMHDLLTGKVQVNIEETA